MADKNIRVTQADQNVDEAKIQSDIAIDEARLDEIAEANQARIASELADLQAMVDVGLEKYEGLGGTKAPSVEKVPGYDMPHQEMLGNVPRNTDSVPYANASPSERGAARGDAAALRPSDSSSDWLSGAASGDATVEKDPETGAVVKTWTLSNDDGSTTRRTSSYDPQSGSQTSGSTTTSADGTSSARVQITDASDGSSDGTTRVTEGGTTMSHSWVRDSSGNMTHDVFETTDSNGRVIDSWDRGNDPRFRDNLARMPRDDATSEAGRRLGARFSHAKPTPPPEVTKVNPGDADDSGPGTSRINPGEGIVVNPSIDVSSQQARQVGAAQAKHWKDELRDKTGGKINPEDGGTGVQ
jgi:hypothetical protein